MTVSAAFTDFCASWLEREPQLLLASQFAAEGMERTRFVATQVLLREFCETAIAVSDPQVAQTRLAWWLDESQHWAAGLPRHPLAQAFEPTAAGALLAELVSATSRWLEAPSASTMADTLRLLDPIAIALAELALPSPVSSARGIAGEGAAGISSWRLCLFACALRLAPAGAPGLASLLPLDLLARHGRRRSDWMAAPPELLCSLIADCAAACPVVAGTAGSRPLRALVEIEQRWLARLAKGVGLARLRVNPGDAFAAWRAARRS